MGGKALEQTVSAPGHSPPPPPPPPGRFECFIWTRERDQERGGQDRRHQYDHDEVGHGDLEKAPSQHAAVAVQIDQ